MRNLKQDEGFQLQQYYGRIKAETFPTAFIVLDRDQMAALLDYYRLALGKITLTPQLSRRLQSLSCKLQKLVPFKAFFVRLNYRSPKDGRIRSFHLKDVWEQEQAKLQAKLPQSACISNLRLRSYYRAQQKGLCCKSPQDILDLFSSSQRTATDLQCCLRENREAVLCVREWDQFIDGDYQFRCFVRANKLLAASQYNHYVLVQQLLPIKHQIKSAILNYFQQVKGPLAYLENYVLDLFIHPNRKPLIIEINPFLPSTGPSLFYWQQSILADQSFEGQFQLRVREQVLKNAREWVQVLENEPEYKTVEAVWPVKGGCSLF